MTREEILLKAQEARAEVTQAMNALDEFVRQMHDVSTDASTGAARTHQQAISHLMDALSLLNQLATRRSSVTDLPHCLRCDKPVDRIDISPKAGNPDLACVEYECHGEVVRQELPVTAADGGLCRYSAFNDYTSGLMLREPAGPS